MIIKIKEALYNNEDKLKRILKDIGCTNIHKTSDVQFRFGMDDKGSGSGNSLFIDTLHFKSFSRSLNGDIITLVQEMLEMDFKQAKNWLADKLNIKVSYKKREIILPFGGFFKNITTNKHLDESPPLVYPLSKLDKFSEYGVSKLWIDDNISGLVQEEFKIGYDLESNRITIPWFTEDGDLCGIMGRLNKSDMNEKEKKYKYLPIIPFSKGKVLYGLYENYRNILNNECIIIVESEKSVLKGRDMGLNNVVALGGNEIHSRQEKLIKSMFCTVILALDEGISMEHCIKQANKVKIKNTFFSNKVYIVDMNNKYIKNNKVSLLDLDKDTIQKILKEHLIYVD